MTRISIGIITGYCLMSLSISSCAHPDDTGTGRESDTDEIAVIDSVSAPHSSFSPEFFNAAHILISFSTAGDNLTDSDEESLALIQDIQDEILAGQATFEEMAFNYSHCTSAADSGRLPTFSSGGITEEIDSTVSALEPGGISGIIRTRFGYHLVKRLSS